MSSEFVSPAEIEKRKAAPAKCGGAELAVAQNIVGGCVTKSPELQTEPLAKLARATEHTILSSA
jgi:hypothetical protein